MMKERNMGMGPLESKINRLDRYWDSAVARGNTILERRIDKWRATLELKLRRLQEPPNPIGQAHLYHQAIELQEA